MWLINVLTLKLEEFWGERIPEYAILSHRWEDEEVSFKDMQYLKTARTKKGFFKIKKSCEQTQKDGHRYVWVDTCCINKESSAELTEAINSMFRWYEAAAVCYAFLSDVDYSPGRPTLGESIWFERGWTLQELIAPRSLVFYDHQWRSMGTKQTLSEVLMYRTGIDESVMHGEPLYHYSIAQRMSWASKRVTTRIEDIAYCLLGIFDVNMPMLYGEGMRAFQRLQEEIIKQSDDHTIFAWPIDDREQTSLLADSPAAFANCGTVRVWRGREGHFPFSMTNRGISIRLVVIPFLLDTYLAKLDCVDENLQPSTMKRMGIFLRRLSHDDQYARVRHEGQTFMHTNFTTWRSVLQGIERAAGREFKERDTGYRQMHVRHELLESTSGVFKMRFNGIRLDSDGLFNRSSSGSCPFTVVGCEWDSRKYTMLATRSKEFKHGLVGIVDLGAQDGKIQFVKLGFDLEFNPICFVATSKALISATRDDPLYLGSGTRDNSELVDPDPLRQYLFRTSFDRYGWSEEISTRRFRDLPKSEGLWALKGDRLNGLKVRLVSMESQEPSKIVAFIKIMKESIENQLVWVVYMDYEDNGKYF
ncbi:MAG: hypothetical protein L6R40_007247 [Gallowayella cf. fulva]|nr:MAG: hypothetical protein L6R40_007247 [Xanthomendoza cf. fulva]